MVFNKSLFASLLLTSSLVVISTAKAGFDEQGNFRLSVAKLKKGYEEGVATLKDGKRFSVQNASLWDQPNFFMAWDDSEKIYGGKNYDYSTYSCKEDGYRFKRQLGEVLVMFKILKQGNGTMITIIQSQALRSFLLF